MGEVTDNILYMTLLHELKASFPAVSDEVVRQCISQFGKDKNRCMEFLINQTDEIRHGHYGRYNQQRKFSLEGSKSFSNRSSFSSFSTKLYPKIPVSSYSSISTLKSSDDFSEAPRRSLTLPVHLKLPPRGGTHPIPKKTPSPISTSNDSVPMVVLTPDSPPLGTRTLYNPGSDYLNDIILCGHSESLTATCLDIDVTNDEIIDEEDDDVCSLSTTTVSQGAIHLMQRGSPGRPLSSTNFTTIQQDTISVSSSRSTCSSSSSTNSSSSSDRGKRQCQRMTKTTFFSTRDTFHHDSCNENPFRKVFVKRKLFYQNIERDGAGGGEDSSSNRLIWRRRLCSLCSSPADHRSTKPEEVNKNVTRLTLNANIRPFAPFVIHHDMNSDTGGTLMLCQNPNSFIEQDENFCCESNNNIKNSSLLLRPCNSGLEINPDGQVRYATSTINSEDGVESHLEVSMCKDGSVITTRHKRLGTPTEVSNNSVLHVKYGEGGNVLNISQSQHLSPSPRATQKSPNRPPLLAPKPRPNSAYCTAQHVPFHTTSSSHFGSLRYNSLPNLYGRCAAMPIYETDQSGSNLWLYNTHPADEEKRMAYTRALLTHQMEQCMKLERQLNLARHEVESVKCDVIELEKKLSINQMITQGKISAESIEKEISELRQTCDSMADEVTKMTKGAVPLGETNFEFYESLATVLDQEGAKLNETLGGSASDIKRQIDSYSNFGDERQQWPCSTCTCFNHPAIQNCEKCNMPRIMIDIDSATNPSILQAMPSR